MTTPTIEIYGSMECPFAYLAIYRLRQLMPQYAGRVQIAWRALSLEFVNNSAVFKPGLTTEGKKLKEVEPNLPFKPWSDLEWKWPSTMLPAFEALACAQAQSPHAAFEMSWALRRAFFAESRNISLRHEVFAIAEQTANEVALDIKRLKADWDSGRYKSTVIAESQRGWHELKVASSATFVLPDGKQLTNPAVGKVDYDEANNVIREYTPPDRDWLTVYREMLDSVAR